MEVDGLACCVRKTLLLATGKHEARGAARRGRPSSLVGFKTYFRLAPAQHQALSGHVELMLFPGGYAGLQMVEGQKANFCVLVEVVCCAGQAANGQICWSICKSPTRIWRRV